MRNKKLLLILIFALLLRIALLYIDYSWDVNNHISWAEDLIKYGFKESFFTTISTHVFGSLYPNYPPLSLYLFYALYPLQSIVHAVVWWLNTTIPVFPSNLIFFVETKPFLAGIYKLPSIAADFGVLYLLVLFGKKLVKNWDKSKTTIVSLLWLFNPVLFYNSAFWGQIDSIPILLGLASFYLALYRKSPVISMLLFTCGLLIKPTIIIFIPVYLYVLLKNHKLPALASGTIFSVCLFYLAYLPFNSNLIEVWKPFVLYYQTVLQAQSLSNVTNSAFNLWALLFTLSGPTDTEKVLGLISYRTLGYLFFAGCLFILYKFKHEKDTLRVVLLGLFFSSFAAFLFLTKMHERYIILCLPFVILLAIENRRFLSWYYVLTTIGFLNMYNSWPVPKIEAVKGILESPSGYKSIALLFLFSFSYLLWNFYLETSNPTIKKKINK